MNMVLSRKGQSTIEYILFFTAALVVCIIFVVSPGSLYQNRLNTTYNSASGSLGPAANAFYNSF